MAFNVSYNFIAIDRFSRVGQKIKRVSSQISAKVRTMSRGFEKSAFSIERFKRKVGDLSRTARSFGSTLFTRVTLPLAALGGAALFQSAKLETLQVSFETMLGSAEKAKVLLEDLVNFAATTPFALGDIAGATKSLLGFGVPLEEMMPTLRMIGDLAAGADVPFGEMAAIFGKVKTVGVAMTEELKQLAERGIPIIQELSNQFKVLPSDVLEAATKSQISFQIIEESLQRMTTEGGIFFDQTSRQSQTLAGLWSTFTDNIKLSLAALGDMNVEIFSLKGLLADIISPLSLMPDKIKTFTAENPELAKMTLIFVGIVAALGPLLIMLGLIGAGLPFVITGFGLLATAMALLGQGILLLLSPIGLFMVAIAAAAFFIFKNWDAVKEKTAELVAAMTEKFTAFKDFVAGIFQSIKENTVGVFTSIGEKIGGAAFEATQFFRGVDTDMQQTLTRNQVLTAQANARADVNVNLNAPRGAVESTSSQVSGNRQAMNLGVNLVTQ